MAKKEHKKGKQEFHYDEYIKNRGDAKEEKSKLKQFLKKRSILQLGVLGAITLSLSIYFMYWMMSLISSPAIWLFLILFIINVICCMWLFAKIGIAVCILLMLGVLMRFGTLAMLAFIWLTGAVWLYFSTRPTPIDFAITKGVQGAAAMIIYQTLWVAVMAPIVSWLGTAYILSHLVFVYMIATIVYVVLMVIFLPIITHEPIPTAFMNGMMMTAIEYAQVRLFGAWFFAYIMSI